MTTFDDRETAFEAKFAHDAEMMFRAQNRRNRIVAMWAAGLMGKDTDAAVDYVREVIKADLEEAGDKDVERKLVRDLGDKSTQEEIRAQMDQAMVRARTELLSEAG